MVSVFVVGFPKSGTSTLQMALQRAGLRAAHQRVAAGFCGEFIYDDYAAGRDPLARLHGYDAITQADVCRPAIRKRGAVNYWPQLDFDVLSAIERHNPDVKFLLNKRDIPALVNSIRKWGSLHERLVEDDVPGLPAGVGTTDEELAAWIQGHYDACARHFRGSPNFLAFDIADENVRKRLKRFLGIRMPWWGVANANATVPEGASRRATAQPRSGAAGDPG